MYLSRRRKNFASRFRVALWYRRRVMWCLTRAQKSWFRGDRSMLAAIQKRGSKQGFKNAVQLSPGFLAGFLPGFWPVFSGKSRNCPVFSGKSRNCPVFGRFFPGFPGFGIVQKRQFFEQSNRYVFRAVEQRQDRDVSEQRFLHVHPESIRRAARQSSMWQQSSFVVVAADCLHCRSQVD